MVSGKSSMPGFMLYFNDWDMPRKILPADVFKIFFDAVFDYARDGEIPPPFDDHSAQVFFDSFMEKINADAGRYQEKCRKASKAAKQSHANASERKQTQANTANTNANTIKNINTNINNQYQNQNGAQQTQANAERAIPPEAQAWIDKKFRECEEEVPF